MRSAKGARKDARRIEVGSWNFVLSLPVILEVLCERLHAPERLHPLLGPYVSGVILDAQAVQELGALMEYTRTNFITIQTPLGKPGTSTMVNSRDL